MLGNAIAVSPKPSSASDAVVPHRDGHQREKDSLMRSSSRAESLIDFVVRAGVRGARRLALTQRVEKAFHVICAGAAPARRILDATGAAANFAAAGKQAFDDRGRDFFADKISNGIAPAAFRGQVEGTIHDACQTNACPALRMIKRHNCLPIHS